VNPDLSMFLDGPRLFEYGMKNIVIVASGLLVRINPDDRRDG